MELINKKLLHFGIFVFNSSIDKEMIPLTGEGTRECLKIWLEGTDDSVFRQLCHNTGKSEANYLTNFVYVLTPRFTDFVQEQRLDLCRSRSMLFETGIYLLKQKIPKKQKITKKYRN